MWKRELGSVNDFIVDGNRILILSIKNDRVMALTIDGGVTLWTQSDLLHRLLTSPVLYNGNLVGDSEGYLHWINVEDGRFVAQQKVDSSGFQTEPVAADGKLLIQAKDGNRVLYYTLIVSVVHFENGPTGAVFLFLTTTRI